jgi:hypothetical protein
MLSEANHLTTGMISFCNCVEINEAKMVQCRAKVLGVYVRFLVVFATRDDSEWELL